MGSQQPVTIPLRILVDKQNDKVVAVESTKDLVDTLFSFLSLPLGTIFRLVSINNQELSFLGSIGNLYQSVQSLTAHDFTTAIVKQMLLRPRNPCEALCSKLALNVDDTEASVMLVCDHCHRFTTFQDMECKCGKRPNKRPQNLDCESDQCNKKSGAAAADVKRGVFVRENGSLFLIFDDLRIVPSSLVTSMQVLTELGYSDLTQLVEITRNIGKDEILSLLKYTLISREPLTNTILAKNSKKKGKPAEQTAPAARVIASGSTTDRKMGIKLIRSKSQNKTIFAEAKEDFVDFIFSFLSMPLGSVAKLLGGNTVVGCVDTLYKSVENMDSSWCTESRALLLNPGVAPQFGAPNQLLNVPDVGHPPLYYGTGVVYADNVVEDNIKGGAISTSPNGVYNEKRLTALDPRSPNRSKEGAVGFVKRPALYGVGDDLKVKSLTVSSCLTYLKEQRVPLDDLEVKVITISEAEALSLLAASLTSKSSLSSGLDGFLEVPKEETTVTP